MPSVPRYDAPTVEARPLPDVSQRSVASPEIFSAGATQAKATAQALAEAGDAALRIKQRWDADTVMRADAGLKDEYIKQEAAWRQNRQGRFADGLSVDAAKWFDDTIKKTGDALKDPQQKALFEQRALRLREQSLSAVSHWQAAQLEKSHDEGWLADKNSTISAAAQTGSPEAIANARYQLTQLNQYQAKRKGWEPSQTENEILKDTTTLHENMIKQLAQTNPVLAADYFEANKKEIDGKRHDEIGKFARTVSATAVGEQNADAVWGALGPKHDGQPVELDKMEAKVRADLKGNEPAMKAALQGLKERAAAQNSSEKERQAANTNVVMGAFGNGATLSSITRMPEFAALPGAKQTEIKQHIQDRQHTLMARSVEDQLRAEREQMIRYSAAYHTYSDPDVLANMTRAQVQALEPVLGRQYTGQLLTKFEAIGKHAGGLTEAKIDRDAMNSILRDVGFDPDKKLNLKSKGDVEYKARLGAMQDEVERQIGVEQKAKNRTLTREEKDTVARRTLSQSVMRSTWFGLSSEPVPASSVIPADLKAIKVPSQDRDTIKRQLERRGKKATDEEIAKWYLMGQRRGATTTAADPAKSVPQ